MRLVERFLAACNGVPPAIPPTFAHVPHVTEDRITGERIVYDPIEMKQLDYTPPYAAKFEIDLHSDIRTGVSMSVNEDGESQITLQTTGFLFVTPVVEPGPSHAARVATARTDLNDVVDALSRLDDVLGELDSFKQAIDRGECHVFAIIGEGGTSLALPSDYARAMKVKELRDNVTRVDAAASRLRQQVEYTIDALQVPDDQHSA